MKNRVINLSLALFGIVPKGKKIRTDFKKSLKYGIIITEDAAHAQTAILSYFKQNKLNAEQLNATFHKSWKVIQNSSRKQLLIHQILHYLTTYGTDFNSDFVYFPAEKLQIPALTKLPIQVIRGVEPSVIIDKCLKMLSSGIAMQEETIDHVLELLAALGHQFTSLEKIKNKEAAIKIIASSGVYPESPVEFLRYLVYLTTKTTLLIKNKETIEAIKTAKKDVSKDLHQFGLKKCATIFNRFKPLWLAFKTNVKNRPLINEMNRLSKRYHQPMPTDVLNTITAIEYQESEIQAALKKANNFRKIRLLNALNTRLNFADTFLYRVRNGKSYSHKKDTYDKIAYYQTAFDLVYQNLALGLKLEGVKIKYPKDVDYALPSSEKMFVGNYPSGTKITAKNLVSGVYWENKWGANDLDLSALSLEGKVGWNSAYKSKGLLYSGDITDAPNGATELLYTENNLPSPALSILNIYSGKAGCKFKIVVGSAPSVSSNYMFNPNELILEATANMVGRQQILGIFLPEPNDQLSFVLVNAGFGSMSVSGNTKQSENARSALFYQYAKSISFRELLIDAGAILVEDEKEADLNLMPQQLQKDTFIEILT